MMRHIGVVILAVALGGCHHIHPCVEEGTVISTPAGSRRVETLRNGDTVWSMSNAGELEPATISAVHRGRAREFVTLLASNGDELRCTPQHLIGTPNGWIAAAELPNDQVVLTCEGSTAIRTQTVYGCSKPVFDLSVAPNQNFIANGFVVHNKTIVQPPVRSQIAGTYVGKVHSRTYRLVLNEDGSGEAASGEMRYTRGYREGHFEPTRLIVQSWRLDKFSIVVELLNPETHRPIELKGRVFGGELLLTTGAVGSEMPFVREAFLREQMTDLENIMATPTTSE